MTPATTSATPTTQNPTVAVATVDAARATAYGQVASELTDFLNMWQSKGYVVASKTYLVPEDQVTPPGIGPVLTSGRVVTVRPSEWMSADRFVVDVELDLAFSGDSGAWGTGTNERFVTATSRSGTIPYVLEFATSP